MTQQPSPVLYLPPGVVPAGTARQAAPAPSGVPFDRAFFESVLPQAVAAFAGQVACGTPVVEVTTVDGKTHYVHGISGVADAWVALHVVHRDDEMVAQVFVPYQTIFRVEIDPCSDMRPRRLGFALNEASPPTVVPAPGATAEGRPAATRKGRRS